MQSFLCQAYLNWTNCRSTELGPAHSQLFPPRKYFVFLSDSFIKFFSNLILPIKSRGKNCFSIMTKIEFKVYLLITCYACSSSNQNIVCLQVFLSLHTVIHNYNKYQYLIFNKIKLRKTIRLDFGFHKIGFFSLVY